MTSKETLEKIAKIYGETNSLVGTYNLFLKIKQDLERLEEINKVWHDNEPMESVDFKAYQLQILYDYINVKEKEIKIFKEENEKLKTAIEIALKYDVSLESVKRLSYVDYVELCIMFNETYPTQQEYELLKEVLSNE